MSESYSVDSNERCWINGIEVSPKEDQQWVKQSNLDLYRRQKAERESLNQQYGADCIVVCVSREKNPRGEYVASIANPILGCDVGFGPTQARALKALGEQMSLDADLILERMSRHEQEIPLLERETADAPPLSEQFLSALNSK